MLTGGLQVKIPLPKRNDHAVIAALVHAESDADDHVMVMNIEAEQEMRDVIQRRIINLSRIEKIVTKSPWERRPDELESVRKEIAKMEVFRKIDVSPAAERDICKFARLKKYMMGDYVIRQGDIGDAFYLILEGSCTVEHTQMGVINQLFASDSFGEVALLEVASPLAPISPFLLHIPLFCSQYLCHGADGLIKTRNARLLL